MKTRKMKGDEEPEMVIGSIMFVLALGFIFVIIFLRLTDYSAVLASGQDTITAISESHRAVACLEKVSSPVDFNKITQKTLDDCNVNDYQVCITDMEKPETKWPADCEITNPDHTMYITLKAGDAIHMGRLNVKKI